MDGKQDSMAAQPSAGFALPSGGTLNSIHEMPASDDSSSGPEAIEDEQTQEKLEVPLRLYPREADTEESSAETTEECEVAARADLEASIRKEPRAHSPDMEVEPGGNRRGIGKRQCPGRRWEENKFGPANYLPGRILLPVNFTFRKLTLWAVRCGVGGGWRRVQQRYFYV